MSVPEVRKADRSETAAMAHTLSLAFYDDPVFAWLLPDTTTRLGTIERGFTDFLTRIWLVHEETYVAPEIEGVCIWEPPGTWKLGIGAQLALLPSFLRIYRSRAPKMIAALTALERNHPTAPHWYLPFIGVAPEHQGRGIGSKLMAPILLACCDAEGSPAYLEASSPRSRALYERHGFVVTEEFTVGKGSPPVWRMWRDPR